MIDNWCLKFWKVKPWGKGLLYTKLKQSWERYWLTIQKLIKMWSTLVSQYLDETGILDIYQSCLNKNRL